MQFTAVNHIACQTSNTTFKALCDRQKPGVELVAYGLNHQVNDWIKNLPPMYLKRLWEDGNVCWGDWRIEWLPGRRFQVKHVRGPWAIVQEAFGFFDQALIPACERWQLFYGMSEDYMIEELMGVFSDAVDRLGCRPLPHWWIGSGSLARAVLDREGVSEHHRHDIGLADGDDHVREAIMTAYYGARAEVYRQGQVTGVKSFDIRSAYPASAYQLPSLRNASLEYRPGEAFDANVKHGIFRAEWKDVRGLIMPLPVRSEQAYWWASAGSGWYHACELHAAIAAGFPIRVGDGFQLVVRDRGRPFAFIRDLYKQRLELDRAGDPAGQVAKTAMNAIYGKLSQGQSHGRSLPRWQSFMWAGELTARVRARLLPVLLACRRPVMVATDGVFSQSISSMVRPSAKLGGWRVGQMDWLFTVNPGVYEATAGRERILRASGFFQDDVDYAELRNGFASEGIDYVHHYTSRRYIGLGVALGRDQPDQWRTWIDEPHTLWMRPKRKTPVLDLDGTYAMRPAKHAPGPSEPYERKQRLVDSRDDTNEQGMDQPLIERI